MLNLIQNTMDNLLCDFSVDFGGIIEDIVPYDETVVNYEDDKLTKLVNKLVDRGHIELQERSEGSIYLSKKLLKIKYRVCVSVGEDWNKDKWEKRKSIILREPYI